MQQKSLIDHLERQIALHQNQMVPLSNNNKRPHTANSSGNGTRGSTPPSSGMNNPNPNLLSQGNMPNSNSQPNHNQLQMQNALMQNNNLMASMTSNGGGRPLGQQLHQNASDNASMIGSMSMPGQTGSMPGQRPSSSPSDVIHNNGNHMNYLLMNAHASMNNPALNLGQNQKFSNPTDNSINGNSNNQGQGQGQGQGNSNSMDRLHSSGGHNPMSSAFDVPLPVPTTADPATSNAGGDDLKSNSGSSPTWEWQSNRDMPDRKHILLGIMKVIENVREGGNQTPEK